MTRQIKFRAWDEESPAMIEWEEIQEEWKINGYSEDLFSSDHYCPMQFTGLKDKFGKEIYEGDIVKSKQFGAVEIQYLNTSYCGVDIDNNIRKIQFGNTWEIIGNIYTSPHLLTSELTTLEK